MRRTLAQALRTLLVDDYDEFYVYDGSDHLSISRGELTARLGNFDSERLFRLRGALRKTLAVLRVGDPTFRRYLLFVTDRSGLHELEQTFLTSQKDFVTLKCVALCLGAERSSELVKTIHLADPHDLTASLLESI